MLVHSMSAFVSVAAMSIATGPETPQEKFAELAAPFAAVGALGGMGTGTLITDEWVLTAAHVADFLRLQGMTPIIFTLDDGREFTVAEVVIHPDWAPLEQQMASRGEDDDMTPGDVALLRLAEPVTGVVPTPLGTFDVDAPEVILVGIGSYSSNATEGVGRREVMGMPRGAKHAGTNVVDRVDHDRNELVISFSEPGNDSATSYEASAFAGDSGGPIMARDGDGWCVIGVIGLVESQGETLGAYGDETRATSVGAIHDWIVGQISD